MTPSPRPSPARGEETPHHNPLPKGERRPLTTSLSPKGRGRKGEGVLDHSNI